MRVIGAVVLGLALMGCQEYNLGQQPPAYQGPNPPALGNAEVTDHILQVPIPAADILWIIDNSGSMLEEQTALKSNFPAFMEYFLGSGIDYHIGVVTTDMEKPAQTGKLQPAGNGEMYITPEDDDPMGMFQEMASVGVLGSSYEMGRDAAYMALVFEPANAGFMRDDQNASLHMTIVSDEPDYSYQVSKSEFSSWANGTRPADELVSFNSICVPPGGGILGYDGADYVDLTNEIGGILHDIRVDDWVNVLDQLGLQAAGLRREFFLSHLPVVDTIEVHVVTPSGDTLPFEANDWSYDRSRNSITFDQFIPDPLSEVFIDYTVLSSLVQVTDEG